MDYTTIISGLIGSEKKIATQNQLVSIWESWLIGKVPSFHNYYVFNGNEKIYKTRLSMHMAKKCVEDWASLLMNEKVFIGVKSQDLLNKELLAIDFYNKTNRSVEYGFSLSFAGLTVEIDNLELGDNKKVKVIEKTKTRLGVYSAKKTIPITFENNECVECAFIQENTNFTKFTVHLLNEDGTYTIVVFSVDNSTGAIDEDSKFEFKSKYQLFALVHPQIVNNIEVDSPYPISIYANALDTLQGIDTAYDSYVNEFTLGRKRIFVSAKLDKVDKDTGTLKRGYDPNEVVFHYLPESVAADGSEKPLIQETTGSLRTQEHSQAIQDLLNFFSSQVGLGVDYYRFEKGRVMTATQVISEKSDTFRNLKKHEGVFEKALYIIIRGLMYAHNEFTTSTEKYEDIETIKIVFDDSIIEDKETEKANDKKEVEFGSMSLVAYRMKWFGEDEETAKNEIHKVYGDSELAKRLQNFAPYFVDGSMSAKDFVDNVYIDKSEQEKEELVEELSKAKESNEDVFANIYRPNNNQE